MTCSPFLLLVSRRQVMERMINFVLLDAFDPGSKQPEYKVCAVKIAKA